LKHLCRALAGGLAGDSGTLFRAEREYSSAQGVNLSQAHPLGANSSILTGYPNIRFITIACFAATCTNMRITSIDDLHQSAFQRFKIRIKRGHRLVLVYIAIGMSISLGVAHNANSVRVAPIYVASSDSNPNLHSGSLNQSRANADLRTQRLAFWIRYDDSFIQDIIARCSEYSVVDGGTAAQIRRIRSAFSIPVTAYDSYTYVSVTARESKYVESLARGLYSAFSDRTIEEDSQWAASRRALVDTELARAKFRVEFMNGKRAKFRENHPDMPLAAVKQGEAGSLENGFAVDQRAFGKIELAYENSVEERRIKSEEFQNAILKERRARDLIAGTIRLAAPPNAEPLLSMTAIVSILVGGPLIGLFTGVAILILKGWADRSLRTVEEIERHLAVPVLARIGFL
jgi:hypothetical protein